MSDTPRMKTKKEMYEDMLTEPTRISSTHSTKAMNVADDMFGGKPKKMAKGGVAKGWGKARSARAAKII